MKKLLIIALALMLALSLCACNNDGNTEDTTGGDGVIDLNPNGTGDGTTNDDPAGSQEETTNDLSVPSEETFTDLEQTVFIVTDYASIRSDTYVSDSTLVAYTSKGAEFKSTAYSENWYKIEYETEVEVTAAEGEEPTTETQTLTCYLHKSVVCVKDLTAEELEEPITVYVIAYALYVRSYYDFTVEGNLMCTLEQGDEVTAVAKGNGWYKIQLSDDADGNPVFGYISSNEKYVSTTKPEETTAADEETTAADEETTAADEETTAAEEATTEAAE